MFLEFFVTFSCVTQMLCFLFTANYTVSQKNIPNILDCNLKTNYQILIIFGTNIVDTTSIMFSTSPKHYLGKADQAK